MELRSIDVGPPTPAGPEPFSPPIEILRLEVGQRLVDRHREIVRTEGGEPFERPVAVEHARNRLPVLLVVGAHVELPPR